MARVEANLALRLLVLAAFLAAYYVRPFAANWFGLFTLLTSCIVMPSRLARA